MRTQAGYGLLFISGLMLVAIIFGWWFERIEVREVARRSVRTYRRCRDCGSIQAWDTERLRYYCACTQRGARIVVLVVRAWAREVTGRGRSRVR